MKQTRKLLSLALMLAMLLALSILPVCALDSESSTIVKEDLDFPVKESYETLEGIVYVLEDGTMYVVTEEGKEWVLPEKEGLSLEVNSGRMLSSLQYMWKGMLCIFVVIGAIILVTLVMNTLCSKAEDRKRIQETKK